MIKHFVFPGSATLVACIYSGGLWYLQVRGYAVHSGAWWFGNSLIGLIGIVATGVRELHLLHAPAQRKEYEAALQRIKTSLNNFQQIRSIQSGTRQFSGDPHRQAVTVKCFEVLDESAKPLTKFWRLRGLVSKLLAENEIQRKLEFEDMDPEKLISLTSQLINNLGGKADN